MKYQILRGVMTASSTGSMSHKLYAEIVRNLRCTPILQKYLSEFLTEKKCNNYALTYVYMYHSSCHLQAAQPRPHTYVLSCYKNSDMTLLA